MEEGPLRGHWRDLPPASRGERFWFTPILIVFATFYVLAVFIVFVVVAIALIPVRTFAAIAARVGAAMRPEMRAVMRAVMKAAKRRG
ncbi:hypothetical protein EN871_31365 [bacterium M00.F.Ca.ET.228.01.1.1]|uniref:hypothetical protein n=1 Tax=Paraburkholderia phenoliruptrix TaxID=252970 RepID=UPI001091F769|nr:hypothetical protein [Paraburkholderia phenoliruptrix]TGP39723.1 hypothetical protein EN871_31365 [bacterium M00.F.Ca.ET.228.01.1.1]TGR95564.1 hypothetical protein EN834_30970 [bacterium M00.F.Ca.ET.191.01.1.1]TGT96552.1 hypothetical protein EN798_30980 [bacterium M00.F.Ca.ET.155.01.1.1]MBW0445060.1 hypothetical protein [Paraburkholderia phenoliruptrix]MBW9095825.1 hypothetical protein [Paraburkholderia phenoliruptrix]